MAGPRAHSLRELLVAAATAGAVSGVAGEAVAAAAGRLGGAGRRRRGVRRFATIRADSEASARLESDQSHPASSSSSLPERSIRSWRLNLARLPDLVPPLPPSTPGSQVSKSSIPWIPRRWGKDAEEEKKTHNIFDALGPVSGVVKHVLRSAAPDTFGKTVLGLKLLALHDADQRRREGYRDPLDDDGHLSGAVVEDTALTDNDDSLKEERREFMNEAHRCMRYSAASYGKPVLCRGEFKFKPVDDNELRLRILPYLGLDPSRARVCLCTWRARWLLPAHLVVHDRDRREVVVAVRGTKSVHDILTDLGAEEVQLFVGGKAHKNMLQGARNVLGQVAPVLEEISEQVDTVTFTGHSLGGGVALYMALLFTELLEQRSALPAAADCERAAWPSVRCFTYGCPGVCSLEVSKALVDCNVVSFCHADDIVPRLSLGHILELQARASAAADAAGEGVRALIEAARDGGGFARAFPEGIETIIAAVRHRATTPSPTAPLQPLPGGSVGAGAPEGDADALKLYPAGRCFLLRQDGAVRELAPEALAPRIELGAGWKQLVLDHLPRRYEAVMATAAARAAAGEKPTPASRL
eukprot:TRINITY_DN16658_c0_g2_i2.p1 TRINITY_DN16658_c0_g2~~TRINITY_DN16658_c0_g2_i2.p1  ORF type:complete len:601 (+),score=120.28 TRINITY_DN16658_c0_g2_i2:54-1805(+)